MSLHLQLTEQIRVERICRHMDIDSEKTLPEVRENHVLKGIWKSGDAMCQIEKKSRSPNDQHYRHENGAVSLVNSASNTKKRQLESNLLLLISARFCFF